MVFDECWGISSTLDGGAVMACGTGIEECEIFENNDELYNPAVNVRAAKMIFDEQGYDAWSVYKTGAYKKFLPKTN